MRLSSKLNDWLHPCMIRYVMRANRRVIEGLEKKHPELFARIDSATEGNHVALWSKLGLPVSVKWCRFFSNISSLKDYRYCPEDVYYARIERILNDANHCGVGCEDKNELDLYVDPERTPQIILRYIRGAFFDAGYKFLSDKSAESLLQKDNGDLIGKVCVNSLGGHGVRVFRYGNGRYSSEEGDALTVERIKKSSSSYVIQKKISQCDFSSKFNPSSANTCRVMTLRCPWNGVIVVLKSAMRIGVTSAVIDNLSSGGITCPMDENGNLSKYAYSWYKDAPFARYEEHPVTGVKFAGQRHPNFDEIKAVVIKAAARIPYMNILGWDILVDGKGDVRILEVNAMSLGMDWPQYDFGGLFGALTEDVVEWCASHKDFDRFSHFRTWF